MLNCPPSPALHFWGHSGCLSMGTLSMGTLHTCWFSCCMARVLQLPLKSPWFGSKCSKPRMELTLYRCPSAEIPLQETSNATMVPPSHMGRETADPVFSFFPTDSPKELLWSQSQNNEMKLFFFCVCHLFQLYWFTPVPGG